jgi:hypothetical protein
MRPAAIVFVPLYSIALLSASFSGVEARLGFWWAEVTTIIGIGGLTAPAVVGAFFGQVGVWQWNWALSLLFATPSILILALLHGDSTRLLFGIR